MGYIMDLRKYVGHKPLIMTCTGVLILNDKSQLLLQKRTDNGCWGYPGGSMELGESFEECARREVLEETGLDCKKLTYFTHKAGVQMHYIYPNGDEIYSAEIIFICDKYQGNLKVQQSEVIEQKFFDLDKLPENISPNNKEVIHMLAKQMLDNGGIIHN